MKKTKYEFMCIMKPFLPEDVREALINKMKKTIEEKDGKVLEEDIWGKRHLAYDIKGHEEGYYLVYDVELPAKNLEEVKEDLNLEADLLRYMFMKE